MASSGEMDLRDALHALFPHDRIIEQCPIRCPKGRTLFVDFMIHGKLLAFEFDGRQHSEFVEHFHTDAAGFSNSKERDRLKEEYLTSHGYVLIRIPYNETVNRKLLRDKVLEALRSAE